MGLIFISGKITSRRLRQVARVVSHHFCRPLLQTEAKSLEFPPFPSNKLPFWRAGVS